VIGDGDRHADTLTRHIALEGAANFRDIGGYRTADGRQVAWRRFFRSDSLAEVTENDLKIIAKLGLRTVYDLRTEHERQRAPDRLPPGLALRVSGQAFFSEKVTKLSERIRSNIIAGELKAQEAEFWLRDRYKLFATEELGEFRRLAQEFLRQDVFPMVVHCASGKDRTGFAVALTLIALGVPREVILEDYLLSNLYRRSLSSYLPANVSPKIVAVLTGVHQSFMLAALEAIDIAWGSDMAFLAEGLGIGVAERRHLRAVLLEPSREV